MDCADNSDEQNCVYRYKKITVLSVNVDYSVVLSSIIVCKTVRLPGAVSSGAFGEVLSDSLSEVRSCSVWK